MFALVTPPNHSVLLPRQPPTAILWLPTAMSSTCDMRDHLTWTDRPLDSRTSWPNAERACYFRGEHRYQSERSLGRRCVCVKRQSHLQYSQPPRGHCSRATESSSKVPRWAFWGEFLLGRATESWVASWSHCCRSRASIPTAQPAGLPHVPLHCSGLPPPPPTLPVSEPCRMNPAVSTLVSALVFQGTFVTLCFGSGTELGWLQSVWRFWLDLSTVSCFFPWHSDAHTITSFQSQFCFLSAGRRILHAKSVPFQTRTVQPHDNCDLSRRKGRNRSGYVSLSRENTQNRKFVKSFLFILFLSFDSRQQPRNPVTVSCVFLLQKRPGGGYTSVFSSNQSDQHSRKCKRIHSAETERPMFTWRIHTKDSDLLEVKHAFCWTDHQYCDSPNDEHLVQPWALLEWQGRASFHGCLWQLDGVLQRFCILSQHFQSNMRMRYARSGWKKFLQMRLPLWRGPH